MVAVGFALAAVLGVALAVALVHRARLAATIERLERTVERAAASEDAARRAYQRLAAAVETIPEGVVLCDEEGAEVLRNRAAAAFVDARHAEVLVEQAVAEGLADALAGSPDRRNLDLVGPPRRMLVLSTVPVPGGAVAVIEDVSERRRLEAVRRDFVANLSHELKTPIGALGLLAETLAAEDDPAVTRRLADRMTSEAFRVAQVIDDLLDLSRIEAEETHRHDAVAVWAVVTDAIERVRPVAESRSIILDATGVRRRHLVHGDRRQLASAVGNLLENGCKYSDPGSVVEVRSQATGTAVDIDVCDHGIGIPARDLERVFERFYRVDRARSRETGGNGLGLAIVRHVAASHGGDVLVTSREGEGSVFTLRLPVGDSRAAPSPVPVEQPA